MHQLAQQFKDLFAGLERAHGTYDLDPKYRVVDEETGKIKGKAVTRQKPVTLELWSEHLEGKGAGLGVIPLKDDGTILFGAIDVDVYDVDPALVAKKIDSLKFPLVPCRSKSGGVHAYCFASSPVSPQSMISRLREMSAVLGGKNEIFPKQAVLDDAATGNWINVPYFGEMEGMRFALLPSGDALDAEEFLALADRLKQPSEFFAQSVQFGDQDNPLVDGPPCLAQLVQVGFDQGTRNDSMYSFGVYLKKKFKDWPKKMHEFNQLYFVKQAGGPDRPPMTTEEVDGIAKSLKGRDYYYQCNKAPLQPICQGAICRTKKYGVRTEDEEKAREQGQMPALGSLRKLLTDPPIWFWDVGDVSVELSTEELQSPRMFQKKVMEKLNVMPGLPKIESWESIVNEAMKRVVFIDAPDDSSTSGQLWEFLEKFCTGRAQAATMDEVLLGKPHTAAGKTYFRMMDFVKFLNVHGFKEMKLNKIAATFKERGLGHEFKAVKKGKGANLWVVDEFAPAPDGVDLPSEITDEKAHF